jgi:hypothetical protein
MEALEHSEIWVAPGRAEAPDQRLLVGIGHRGIMA